jgi:hypothetical protein
MSRYAATIHELAATPRTHERIDAVTATPAYAALMTELRTFAVRHRADPEAEVPNAVLAGMAGALNVPSIHLEALANVPEDKVAKWKPAIINADLVESDSVTKTSDTPFQRGLDKLSAFLPEPKRVTIPGLGAVYQAIGALLPAVDALGHIVSDPMDAAAQGVRGWSDALASDVQSKLRAMREALAPGGLSVKAVANLPEPEQRMVLLAAESLTGMALDAELFVRWARDPNGVEVDQGFQARIGRFASTGLMGLAGLLGAVASGIDGLTDEKGWRSFAVHLTGGGNLEKMTVTVARPGLTLMFPSLEQVDRNGGKATLQIYFRFCPLDSMYGGISLNPRGTSIKARTGPVGASISDYGHVIRLGIPGMYGFNFGEDYAYGATAAVGYSPVVARLPGVKVRAGGKIDVFHPSPVALGALAGGAAILGALMGGVAIPPLAWVLVPAAGSVVVGTLFPYARSLARGIALGCDAVYRPIVRWIHSVAHKIGLAKTAPKTSEDGWPISQRWDLVRRSVERAEAASAAAKDRLERLRAIEPGALAEVVGEDRSRQLLRAHAEHPAEVHRTMVAYLESFIREAGTKTASVRAMAKAKAEGAHADMGEVKRLAAELDTHATAFEFVDALVASLLLPDPIVEVEAQPAAEAA